MLKFFISSLFIKLNIHILNIKNKKENTMIWYIHSIQKLFASYAVRIKDWIVEYFIYKECYMSSI